MAGRVHWRVDPMAARGFGPHQVVVYIASVYAGTRCVDSVACANRIEARKLAAQMADDCANVSFAPDTSTSHGGHR